MFPYRRLASTFKSCVFSVARPVASASNVMQHRGLISSAPRRAELPSSPTSDVGEQASNDSVDEDMDLSDLMTEQRGNDTGPASYRQFLEEIGYKYKFASPQRWLGNRIVEFVHSFHADDRIVHHRTSVIAISHEPVV